MLDNTKGLGVPGVIILTASDNSEINNSLLTVYQILDIHLNAKLAVSSICDTGHGRVTGDGMVELPRSLIMVEVPSIIASF
mgnify:CR=1 FL=1